MTVQPRSNPRRTASPFDVEAQIASATETLAAEFPGADVTQIRAALLYAQRDVGASGDWTRVIMVARHRLREVLASWLGHPTAVPAAA